MQPNSNKDIGLSFESYMKEYNLKCYKCNKDTDRVIPIHELDRDNPLFGFKVLYYCKTCFKNFLNT